MIQTLDLRINPTNRCRGTTRDNVKVALQLFFQDGPPKLIRGDIVEIAPSSRRSVEILGDSYFRDRPPRIFELSSRGLRANNHPIKSAQNDFRDYWETVNVITANAAQPAVWITT